MTTVLKQSLRDAKFTSRDWLAYNLNDLRLAAVLIAGVAILGFLMSFDLPTAKLLVGK
jgi:hypothetical protein